jgi:hypothetical protein
MRKIDRLSLYRKISKIEKEHAALKKCALPTLVLVYHRSNNITAKHADILVSRAKVSHATSSK